MALKTVTISTCDGDGTSRCSAELRWPGDGVVVHGHVTTAGPQDTAVRTLISKTGEGVALCWACLRKRLSIPQPMEASQPRRERERDDPSYESTYTDPYRRPGHGPTGPLMPPDMPRCVRVVRMLTLGGDHG